MSEESFGKTGWWTTWHIAALIAVAAIAVAPAWWLGSWCSVPELGEHYVGSHITIEGIPSEEERTLQQADQGASGSIPPLPPSRYGKIRSTQTTDYVANEIGDWWRKFACDVTLADYILALFTIVLAASTVFLWLETRRLARGSDDQAEKMQASIAEAARAATASEKAVKVAEDALVLYERPWIFVSLSPRIYYSDELGIWSARFSMSNHGRSPAIVEVALVVMGAIIGDAPPVGILQDELHGPLGPGEKIEGVSLLVPDGIDINFVGGAIGGEPVMPADEDLGICISIHYRDIAGRTHNSAFAWRYDMGVNRWVKYDGEQYNYQN